MRRGGIAFSLCLKGGLAFLLLVLLGRPELVDLSDRAFTGRVVLAVVALVAVPAGVHRVHETMYEETLSDLAFSLLGSAPGAGLVLLVGARTQVSPRPRPPTTGRALLRSPY